MNIRATFLKDKLTVELFDTARDMGMAAATFVAEKLTKAITEKGSANLIMATGASQFPFLDAFLGIKIDWRKITLFHLDEYVGLSDEHPASFRRFIRERIADKVNPRTVYYLNGDAANVKAELKRYEMLLRSHPVDVACIGIGENGHIAFNDPSVADFNEVDYVKVVPLDEICRKQQVGEGWFPDFEHVPEKALTLTIQAIMDCKVISCTVPDERKAEAVYNTLNGEISTSCPASILRKHKEAVLFLDRYSALKIK